MSIYMSRAELEEISEGLITAYANKFSNRVIQSIDIEHFITEFLMLRIEYASFAEDDAGRIGFLADGATPLLVHQDGKIIPFVFPKDTIVLDKFLLAEKEQGRRRFTMAHEASHHILSKMYAMPSEGRFHAEYDSERSYSKEELAQMFASAEWQAQHQATLNKAIRRIIRDCNDEQFLHSDEPDVLLPHFSCHSLRHTFTTRMCEAGVNIKVIQDALGHSDISTTLNIYADVTKEMKAEEFKGLDSYFKV